MICKNCATACEGNFCYHCGQATATSRLTIKQLLSDTFFSLVKVNRGFLFTVKSLLVKPGKHIRAYIEGQRVIYYPPHKYLLLIGTVATFFSIRYHFFSYQYTFSMIPEGEINAFFTDFFQYADAYTTLINIVTIPVFALFSWLFFQKNAFNYAEHLVVNTYITTQQLLLFIVMVPVFEINLTSQTYLLPFYILVTLLYNWWVYTDFFCLRTWKGTFLACLVIFLAYLCQLLLNLLIYIITKPLLDL